MGVSQAKKQLKQLISVDDKKRWDELKQITDLSGNALMSQLIRSLHYNAFKELKKIGLVSEQRFSDLEAGGKIIETIIKVKRCPSIQKKLL
ncbi:MAG: hypothetical protein [Thorarchaeia virus VerdaV2]|uniref:Uncharacterized protein n=1 Tax=Thorarchaeia virus VerdaV2 TaxID=3070171 RepID=A0AA35CPK6_9CAUD|nr:MAG: hypothetical protein QIT42_gp29 [Thorarchaeia virus VerdaV2]BDI54923.1 MAG: hypothetical protein [Thorarchaeia virus VerdaV2]